MTSEKRIYTVARANKALPLVSRIAEDIAAKCAEHDRLDGARKKARHEELETIERRLFDLQGELERHVNELEQLGVELKDPRRGLLDFVGKRGAQAIYLCWMRGEASVAWWHPLETGFPGRRPVAELPPETRGE